MPGNHDKQARKLEAEFAWLADLTEVSVHGQPIVLCHYALPSATGPIADRGTSTGILMDGCQKRLSHSRRMWESTHTISDHGSLTNLPDYEGEGGEPVVSLALALALRRWQKAPSARY